MAEPFALTPADPAFDLREPVTVNGYPYVPAEPSRRREPARPVPGGRNKAVVEVKRRKLVERLAQEMERRERFEQECG